MILEKEPGLRKGTGCIYLTEIALKRLKNQFNLKPLAIGRYCNLVLIK